VLLDVLLPDANGFEVAELLAAEPRRPVVVLTSSRSADDLGASLDRTSARGFISKHDLTAESLATMVGEL
jgi:DNA-binding NarL/FixJ family response regulator